MHDRPIPTTPPHLQTIAALSDDELLRQLGRLVARSRCVESEVVAHIAEVDVRRLWAREATSSMFAYCVEVLHLSEPEAYLRIAVARASRQHPVLLDMLADGRLHLSGIAKLAPHLSAGNLDAVLARAAHRSKREIEELVAELEPRPDVRALVRKLPLVPAARSALQLRPDAVSTTPSPARPAVVQPMAPERYKIQFTASAALRHKLERLMALMRGTVPSGDLGAVVEVAVTEKLARLEARRFGGTALPKVLTSADTSASVLSLHTRSGATAGRTARRAPVQLHHSGRPPLRRSGPTGVPPRAAPRARRRPVGRQHPAPVPRAQRLHG